MKAVADIVRNSVRKIPAIGKIARLVGNIRLLKGIRSPDSLAMVLDMIHRTGKTIVALRLTDIIDRRSNIVVRHRLIGLCRYIVTTMIIIIIAIIAILMIGTGTAGEDTETVLFVIGIIIIAILTVCSAIISGEL